VHFLKKTATVYFKIVVNVPTALMLALHCLNVSSQHSNINLLVQHWILQQNINLRIIRTTNCTTTIQQ